MVRARAAIPADRARPLLPGPRARHASPVRTVANGGRGKRAEPARCRLMVPRLARSIGVISSRSTIMHGITPAGPWTAVRVPHPRAHECGTGGPLIPAAIAGRSVDLVLAMCGGRGLE